METRMIFRIYFYYWQIIIKIAIFIYRKIWLKIIQRRNHKIINHYFFLVFCFAFNSKTGLYLVDNERKTPKCILLGVIQSYDLDEELSHFMTERILKCHRWPVLKNHLQDIPYFFIKLQYVWLMIYSKNAYHNYVSICTCSDFT